MSFLIKWVNQIFAANPHPLIFHGGHALACMACCYMVLSSLVSLHQLWAPGWARGERTSLATCCKITLAKKVLSHELGRHHTPHLSSPFHLATVFLGCAFFPTSSSFLNHQQPEFCPQQLSSNCSLLTKSKRSGPVSPLLAHLQLLAPTTHLLTYNTLHSQLINVVSSTPHSP